jgi:endonuclease/exonuclease/phosphatase (EEP) superfamily protein YafD
MERAAGSRVPCSGTSDEMTTEPSALAEPRAMRRFMPVMPVALLALVTGASLLGPWWWVPALIVHFRPHLATACLIALVGSAIARRPLMVALCLAMVAIHGAPLLPYLGGAGGANAASPANLRILELNMHGASTAVAALGQTIETEHPDLVVLTEMPGNVDKIAREIAAMPAYRAGEPPPSPWAVTLFSRWPIAHWTVERGADGTAQVLSADICDIPAWRGCLRLVAVHAPRPFGDGARRQRDQLAIAAQAAASAPDRRSVLAGDLNLTPWSPVFSELLARGNLRDTGPYRGLLATWLSRLPFIGLLIDHVLVSPTVVILANRLGDDLGSDHLPVIADLAIPAEPQ